jgi:hypothetical protein
MTKKALKTHVDQKVFKAKKIHMYSLRAGELVYKMTWYTPIRHLTPGHPDEMELQILQKMKLRMRRIQSVLVVNLIRMTLTKTIDNTQNTMNPEFQPWSEFPSPPL